MPQMSPLLWFNLMLMTLLTYSMLMATIYFFTFYTKPFYKSMKKKINIKKW